MPYPHLTLLDITYLVSSSTNHTVPQYPIFSNPLLLPPHFGPNNIQPQETEITLQTHCMLQYLGKIVT